MVASGKMVPANLARIISAVISVGMSLVPPCAAMKKGQNTFVLSLPMPTSCLHRAANSPDIFLHSCNSSEDTLWMGALGAFRFEIIPSP